MNFFNNNNNNQAPINGTIDYIFSSKKEILNNIIKLTDEAKSKEEIFNLLKDLINCIELEDIKRKNIIMGIIEYGNKATAINLMQSESSNLKTTKQIYLKHKEIINDNNNKKNNK